MVSRLHKTPSAQLVAHAVSEAALFADISRDAIDEILSVATIRSMPKGQMLFMQDDEADNFYIIASGWVKLFRETLEGDEAVIDVLTDGHVFGETSLFEDGIHSCNAQVVESTNVVVIPTQTLKHVVAENNQLAFNMLHSLSQHRRLKDREIEHLNLQNAPQRIGCFLLRLLPLKGPDFEPPESAQLHLPYDKTLIASRLGMKPETFSRALARLRQETTITINGSAVTVNNVQDLVHYTCNNCSDGFPCSDLT